MRMTFKPMKFKQADDILYIALSMSLAVFHLHNEPVAEHFESLGVKQCQQISLWDIETPQKIS